MILQVVVANADRLTSTAPYEEGYRSNQGGSLTRGGYGLDSPRNYDYSGIDQHKHPHQCRKGPSRWDSRLKPWK